MQRQNLLRDLIIRLTDIAQHALDEAQRERIVELIRNYEKELRKLEGIKKDDKETPKK